MNISLEQLIDLTINQELSWVVLSTIKEKLRDTHQSLKDVDTLHNYLLLLQSNYFIFDCEKTFVCITEDKKIIIVSQSKNDFGKYRIDCYESFKWNNKECPINYFYRLINAIVFKNDLHNSENCSKILSIISEQ